MTTTITDAEVEAACNAYDGQCFRMASPSAMRAALTAAAQAQGRVPTLERQLTEAREVIKPFAVMAGQIDEWQNGHDPNCNFKFDANDLRRAREWLKAGADEA